MGKLLKRSKIAIDTIGGLPDDILACIVSLLTMKQAARTSILSRRWRYIWKISVVNFPSIHLDVLPMEHINICDYEFDDCVNRDVIRVSYYLHSKSRATEMRKCAGYVFQILHLDHSSVRNSFRFRFYMEKEFVRHDGQWIIIAMTQLNDFAHNINQWIDMAIAKRSQNYRTDLSHLVIMRKIYHDGNHYYQFPRLFSTVKVGSSMNRFCLKCCYVSLPDFNVFRFLINLRLKNIVVGKEATDNILSNCPNLERLGLYHCKGLHTLKICGPSLKLKQLIILYCFDIKKITIDAKNLAQFLYFGFGLELMPINVPRLSEMLFQNPNVFSLGGLSYARGKMSSDFPRLETLIISVVPMEEKKLSRQLPLFCNLKKLILLALASTPRGTLWGFAHLLQASPHLRWFELQLEIWDSISVEDYELMDRPCDFSHELMDRPCDFSHNNLKVIMLGGLSGSSHEMEFAIYLLNTATNLKSFIVLSKRLLFEHGTGYRTFYSEQRLAELSAETNGGVWEKLRNLKRPDVKLVFGV